MKSCYLCGAILADNYESEDIVARQSCEMRSRRDAQA